MFLLYKLAEREEFEPSVFLYISIGYLSMLAASCQNLPWVTHR